MVINYKNCIRTIYPPSYDFRYARKNFDDFSHIDVYSWLFFLVMMHLSQI